MKNFTKLFLVATLLCSQFLGFAADLHSNKTNQENKKGVAPVYKGGSTLWKLMPGGKGTTLSLSAQNSRPAFVSNEAEHTCSKIYASAVSQVFHVKESKPGKSMYTTVSLAAFAPGNEIKSPSINAYPNPSRGVTKLSLNLPGNDNYKIRVSNTIGRVVYTQEVSNYESTAVDLDMRSLPSGIYFYSLLVNDKTVETKRLVLQK